MGLTWDNGPGWGPDRGRGEGECLLWDRGEVLEGGGALYL